MKVIRRENPVFVDVDSTLVLPNETKYQGNEQVSIYDSVTGSYLTMYKHAPNIRLLLEEKHRGSFIVVWSRGGFDWAENVLKALNITYAVDLVMTKPLVYIDDLDISNWLPYRVYLEPNTAYKKP